MMDLGTSRIAFWAAMCFWAAGIGLIVFMEAMLLTPWFIPYSDPPAAKRASLRGRMWLSIDRRVNRRWYALKRDAGGLLRPAVYKALYHEAKRMPDLDFLEVGGAHGAASIALAWGMRDSGKRSKLVVAEKADTRLRANLERAGVAGRVTVYQHGVTNETALEVRSMLGERIAGFMHDADGWIDRDFAHFWELVVPGGLIVIDDVPASAHTDQEKKRRTYHLCRQLVQWGLFQPRRRIGDTLIGHKPPGADLGEFDRAWLQELVRRVDEVKPLPRVEW